MKLIIIDSLVNPPTDILYFRFLTLVSKTNLLLDCLLETAPETKDIYFHYLKSRGALDFIEQIITEKEQETGIRLAPELQYPLSIRVKAITGENCNNLLGQIKTLTKIDQV